MTFKNNKTMKLFVAATAFIFSAQLLISVTQTFAAKQVAFAKSSASSSASTQTNNDSQYVTISSTKKIPNQTYDQVLTGQKLIFDQPGTTSIDHVKYTSSQVRGLIKQGARFMAYQKATAVNGLVYYKIVSAHHYFRGWINSAGITSANSSNSSRKQSNLVSDSKASSSDDTNLANFNVLLKSAYESLNKMKITKNSSNSAQFILAKNDLQGAASSAKQIANTSIKNNALSQLNNATQYMNKLTK